MHKDQAQHPQRVFGYDVLNTLGHGAASVIYAASRPGDKRVFALKHVICRRERDRRFIDQVRNEYAVGSRVRCPGLRRPLELLTDRTWLHREHEVALVMELFEGVCLDHYRSLTPVEAISCGLTVARALNAMHEAGFLHCDMKPANVLRSDDGQYCVIDLGQACPTGTVKKRIQGTPAFMAPEQFHRRPVCAHSDVYNLGATLYWLLTHRALTTACTLDRKSNSFLLDVTQPAPHELNNAIPEGLSRLIMKCVRTNPEHRPAAMLDLVRQLETIAYMLCHAHAAAIDGNVDVAAHSNHPPDPFEHTAPLAHP